VLVTIDEVAYELLFSSGSYSAAQTARSGALHV
jgi:hypothetical protein